MNNFPIEIELKNKSNGFALFDPCNLDRFRHIYNITALDLEDFFDENQIIAERSIDSGVIIPCYIDRPDTYRIIVSGKGIVKKENQKCINSNMLLEISGGKLAVADLCALRMWSVDNYKLFARQGIPTHHLVELENGMYTVDIIGFICGDTRGYNLVFTRNVDKMERYAEAREFNEQFDGETREITALTARYLWDGAKWGKFRLWELRMKIAAWKYQDSPEIVTGDYYLVSKADRQYRKELDQRIECNHIVALKVRQYKNKFLLMEIIQQDDKNDDKSINQSVTLKILPRNLRSQKIKEINLAFSKSFVTFLFSYST
ncbi:MAG: hypothetical protein LBK13_03250 [Spirochaetales bacterium]|jgi:hypothetical protein|nr:hypothetical protein [Spirochaetales bacterium]